MKQKTFWQKLKDKLTISVLFYILLIGVVVILTLFPVIFDLEHANWNKIISNCIISLILVLLTFSYQSTSVKSNAEKDEESELTTTKNNHIKKIKEIQNLSLSKLHEIYVNEKNEEIKQEYIKQVFHSYEIPIELYDCEKSLLDVALKNNKINEEQYDIIRKMRKGKFEVDYYNLQDLTCSVILNKSKNTNKSQQNEIIITELSSKVLLIIITSFLWGTLVPSSFEAGITAQSWIDLGGRLITTISGIWCGNVCGKMMVKDDIRLYNKFFNFNNQFLQDFKTKIWQPKKNIIDVDIIQELHNLANDEFIEVDEDVLNKIKEDM